MHARYLIAAVVALALAATLSIAPADAAKVCKEPMEAKSTSRIQQSDTAREARARDNAIKRWSASVQQTHGIAYKYWWRADDKKIQCDSTPKTKRCTVSAKPCRIY